MSSQSPRPAADPARKTVFLHVGSRKSGTSALQLGLQRGADQLRAHGLAQPLAGRAEVLRGLVRPLQQVDGDDDDAARKAVARLAATIRDSQEPRHLITLEALAELPAEATSVVVEGLAEFDTRVVVTTRPWAVTIPSEWQQLVKSRFTGEYDAFARAVRSPEGVEDTLGREAARFHRRQDAADVVRRWRAADPDLPVHVVLVPTDRDTRPDLNELFCQVIDARTDHLSTPPRLVNQSLTHPDAEVLRQVNLALGDRLQDLRGDYRYSVRKWIAVGAMMGNSSGSRIRLPRDLEEWATGQSTRQLEDLRGQGCEIVGDAEGYLRPRLSGEDFQPATDAEVAAAAAATIANLAERHERERRRAKQRARKRSRQQPPPEAAPAGRRTRAVAQARRVPGALRRRAAARLRR